MTRRFQQGKQEDPQSRRLCILLVEHHPLIRQGLRRLLEMECKGAIVSEVESAEEALRLTEQWQPDLAIIDLALPPRAGIATIRSLKRQCPLTVVMALSLEDEEPYRRAVGEGDAAVLVRQDGHAQALLIALRACIAKCSVWQTGAERGTPPGKPDGGTSAPLIQTSENQTSAHRWNSTSSGVERESHNSKGEP